MRLPYALWRGISPSKVTDYFLDPEHPEGRRKAEFFISIGFSGAEKETLMTALYDHPIRNEVSEVIRGPYGEKYVVTGPIETPRGQEAVVTTIWIVEASRRPRLVTAFPG
jgi:hypothetical protein